MADDRDEAGRFAAGNKCGPGRPRRATEARYMAALGDAVSLDDWQAIVRKAVDEAKQGDAQSRLWLSRYVLGHEPPSLLSIAGRELRSETTDLLVDDIQQEVERQNQEQLDRERCARLRNATDEILSRLPGGS